jgi:hypothetical protein
MRTLLAQTCASQSFFAPASWTCATQAAVNAFFAQESHAGVPGGSQVGGIRSSNTCLRLHLQNLMMQLAIVKRPRPGR